MSSGDINISNRLFVVSDSSLNARLFVAGDASLNGNVSTGKDMNINGNLSVKQYKTNLTVYTVDYQLVVAQDLSVNGRLFMTDDASMNKRLFVGGDVSMNRNAYIAGNLTLAPTSVLSGGTVTRASNIAGGLGGSIPYQTAVNTTALLANGTAGQVLTSQGTTLAPIWAAGGGGGNATNIAGGVAGAIPYQTAVSTTGFSAAGTAGQILQSNGTGAPTFSSILIADNVLLGGTAVRTGAGTIKVAIGNGAGITNQGSNAVAIGNGAGNANQGAESIAIGRESGVNGSCAQGAVAVGYNTSAGGIRAVCIGQSSISNGKSGVAIGENANNLTGENSVAIGFQATSGTFSSSVALGTGATCTASNQIRLGRATENVSIPGTLQIKATGVVTGMLAGIVGGSGSGSGTTTFGVTFATPPYVVATIIFVSTGAHFSVVVHSITTTQFQWNRSFINISSGVASNAGISGDPFNWIAISI